MLRPGGVHTGILAFFCRNLGAVCGRNLEVVGEKIGFVLVIFVWLKPIFDLMKRTRPGAKQLFVGFGIRRSGQDLPR